MSKTKVHRPIAEIEAELQAAKTPGAHDKLTGRDDHRIAEQLKLTFELAEAKKYWALHNATAAAQERAADYQQLHETLTHSDGRSLDPETQRRFDTANRLANKLFGK